MKIIQGFFSPACTCPAVVCIARKVFIVFELQIGVTRAGGWNGKMNSSHHLTVYSQAGESNVKRAGISSKKMVKIFFFSG